jgi:hypothetical protein
VTIETVEISLKAMKVKTGLGEQLNLEERRS